MEKKIEDDLSEIQFGFRKNRGTREAIRCLRIMIEKCEQASVCGILELGESLRQCGVEQDIWASGKTLNITTTEE
jgi:hypothetical protein